MGFVREVIVALGLLTACGSSPPPVAAPVEPSLDQKKAESDVRGLVTEIYRTLNRTNTDGLMTLVAEPLVVFGPRQVDAMTTRSDALVALRTYIDDKAKKLSLRSANLIVVASPGGRSAVAIDLFVAQGERMAVTTVLAYADELWAVTAIDLAKTPASGSVRTALKTDAIVPTGMAGTPKRDEAAVGAVERFLAGLTNPTFVGEDLAHDGAVAVGPAGEITRGKVPITKAWAKRAKLHVRAASAGEVSSGLTADRQLAWVSAPVVRFEDKEEPLPLRVFAVYARAGKLWRMVAYHESLAIEDAGSGAAYRKISAPPLPVPPPPKPAPAKPTKKPRK